MNKGTQHANAGPLTDDEIRSALENSGYAVELELLNEMKSAGVPAAIGPRYPVAPGKFQEVDLVGRLHQKLRAQDGADPVYAILSLLVQVKRHSGPASFLGLRGAAAQDVDQLLPRLGLIGSILSEDADIYGVADMIMGDGTHPGDGQKRGIVSCAIPFASLPVCAHWAIVRRRKEENWAPWATGEKGFFDDFEGLTQVREMLKSQGRENRMRDKGHTPRVNQVVLCMVVDAESLALYDPVTRALDRVQELTICKAFDTPNGPIAPYIDVVARPAFAAYLARVKQAAALLADAVRDQREAVRAIIGTLRERDQVDHLNSLP